MKQFLPLVILFLAISIAKGQNPVSKAEVFSICINLPELQDYLLTDSGELPDELIVYNGGDQFSNIEMPSKFGKQVRLIEKNELKTSSINSYLSFYIFEVKDNKARVDYKCLQNGSIKLNVYLELEKTLNGWDIIKSKIEEK